MKKGCLVALAVIAALVVGVLIFVFGLTHGVVKSADHFLETLGHGDIAAAYQETFATLRRRQSQISFAETVKGLGLTDYASVFWSNRKVANDRGHLEGTVTTRAGGKIPLTIELVKEAGTWKIIYLQAPRAGVTTEEGGRPKPTDAQVQALALTSLLAFNQAVAEKNFAGFHGTISRAWQEQITPDRLNEVFAYFIEHSIDISGIKSVDPILTAPPQIDENGLLILEGYYPTKPNRVQYRLKYVYEHPQWKLFGIKVDVTQ